jgi:predicted nucleotide-binding protein
VNRDEKIRVLQQQIADARNGDPEDFELWQQRTEVVVRNVLGDANPLYINFQRIPYSLRMYSLETPRSAHEEARVKGVRKAISLLQAAILEVEMSGGAPEPSPGSVAAGSAVFIVHGHDEARKHEVARLVRALTGNEPIILHERANEGRTIIEKFEDHAAATGYAIVLGTADDVGRPMDEGNDQLRSRPRQNVVFELGFFFGALGRAKVALLHEESVERPSDTDGIIRIPIDSAGGWKMLIARELDAAGIGVDWTALR